MRHRLVLAPLAMSLLLVACVNGPLSKPPVAATQTVTAAAATLSIRGRALAPSALLASGALAPVAPAGVLSNASSTVISNASSTVVSNASSTVIANASSTLTREHLLAFDTRPVAGAAVFLTDKNGNPLANTPVVQTDTQGGFVLPRVPVGHDWVLAVRVANKAGAQGNLETLVNATTQDATATVTAASTLVTVGLTQGQGGVTGSFDADAYTRTVSAVDGDLTVSALPDFTNPSAVLAAFNALLLDIDQRVKQTDQDVNTLKSQVAENQSEIQQQLAQIQGELAAIARQQASAAPASASPSSGQATPVPASAAPTPASTASASSQPASPAPSVQAAGPAPSPSASPGLYILVNASAGLSSPAGLAFDAQGNLYVADTGHNQIRKLDAQSNFTVLAGTGAAGQANGAGLQASFNQPNGLAIVGTTLYVVESLNHDIRAIDLQASDHQVRLVAGTPGQTGYVDGSALAAKFNSPRGIVADGSGNLYVTDRANLRIRKIDTAGNVTTFAGNGTSGGQDGTGPGASFNGPEGITIDASGTLYVTEHPGCVVRAITPGGKVSTIAGVPGQAGFADGPAAAALFGEPTGIAVAADGRIYVCDWSNQRIRRIDRTQGSVATVVGTGQASDAGGASLATAQVNDPFGLVVGPGGFLFATEAGGNCVRLLAP